MTEQELYDILRCVRGADRAAMDRARQRQAALAKPPGSLGALETAAVRLAGITGRPCSAADICRVLVFAADNGVVAEGVSCTPAAVTLRQSVQMTRYKTGMSAMAHYFGDSVVVTDVGIAAPAPAPIVNRKIRLGTGSIVREPAMTRQQAVDAVAAGLEAAENAASDGVQAVGIGEMGIGNTTTSAAVLCALTGASPEEATGRGSGLTDEAFARKKEVVARALALHAPDREDVIGVLSAVGGLDIAAMCGAYLGCAVHRLPAVADGYISTVAALCAVRLCAAAADVIFLSHASCEAGWRIAAQALGQEPCLQLDMRLGEGSGCVLMFRVLQAACAAMRDMATFSEAAIDDGYLAEIRACGASAVTP